MRGIHEHSPNPFNNVWLACLGDASDPAAPGVISPGSQGTPVQFKSTPVRARKNTNAIHNNPLYLKPLDLGKHIVYSKGYILYLECFIFRRIDATLLWWVVLWLNWNQYTGWKRELVIRSATDSSGRKTGDIYYYTPTGKKCRSGREVQEQRKSHLEASKIIVWL